MATEDGSENVNVHSTECLTQEEYERISEEHLKKCCSINWKIGPIRIELNPIVTIASGIVIWGLVAWCCADPIGSFNLLTPVMLWITKTWTWLYIGTQDVWALLIIAIYFSKYGNLKLGRQNEEPEFSDAAYFTMLFAAGIGIGLFYFGVAETMFHYEPGPYGNRYWNRYSDNQRAQDAINLTYFHWGIHGWIVYVILGMLLSFICYRRGLPMSVRSCFYPILGERIFGWLGDLIDTLSVVCTMFGVCTSLGLGAMQLNRGLNRMNSDIVYGINTQIILIWVITLMATASVISGLKVGIKLLSEICFLLGNFIMLIWLFYDDTWYMLNAVVQSVGYYVQNIIGLGFHTDAFAQMNNAPDGKSAPNWLNDWTIFYWGWWIAWAPFVGMFIAKISRGRTIKQFIMHTMTVPCIYIFFWFGMFGAAGIKMEREAVLANITCDSEFGGKNSTAPFNGLYRLSCRDSTDMWFDLMESFPALYPFLAIISLIGIILYFVTSSDSGSLVIDSLAANGHPDPPRLQRIFWAFTEGACATGLLVSGGDQGLKALRVVSIAAGLPYTIVLNFMCIALWRVLQIEGGDLDPDGPAFTHDLFNIFESAKRFVGFLVAIVAPWFSVGRAHAKITNTRGWANMFTLAFLFYAAIILVVLEAAYAGLAYIGGAIYFGFAGAAARTRIQMREDLGINGNMIEDFFAVLILYPFAALQMDDHMNDMIDVEILNGNVQAMEDMPPKYAEMEDGIDNPAFKSNGGANGIEKKAEAENSRL
ncbi:glycine betaine transporter 1-like [Liolophura sinensis]|uniref:glycine betaine transporter 1-like n=1 Tax=Liolophura sinensis TaxID=3198878 RepID=UPI003158610D